MMSMANGDLWRCAWEWQGSSVAYYQSDVRQKMGALLGHFYFLRLNPTCLEFCDSPLTKFFSNPSWWKEKISFPIFLSGGSGGRF